MKSNVKMIFSDDLQAAADDILKQICFDTDIRVVVIASYPAIHERWRKAISVAGNICSASVVRGSAKDKDKVIRSDTQIIFVSPGSAGRILANKEVKTDILIVDDLEGLVSIRKEFKYNISDIAHNAVQTVGIGGSLNGGNLRYLPEVLRIMGIDETKGMSQNGFYERYYFKDYQKKDKATICRLEPKPGAVEAVKRFLGEICELQVMGKAETEDMKISEYEDYIPLDYKEKSKYSFMKWIQEEKVHGRCIGYYNDQYV